MRAMPTIRARSTRRATIRPRATYSRAYLHHLVKANEMLGAMLLSAINLAYYQSLMRGMREAIAARQFEDFRARDKREWARGDIAPIIS